MQARNQLMQAKSQFQAAKDGLSEGVQRDDNLL
jgi:hypothetical protein